MSGSAHNSIQKDIVQPQLYICMLGGLTVHIGYQPIKATFGGILGRLLACMALHAPRAISRERLIGLLYPDENETRARRMLTDAIYRIRRELESFSSQETVDQWLIVDADGLYLNTHLVWIDALVFSQLTHKDGLKEWQHALSMYRGELLQEFDDDWAIGPRTALQENYLTLLENTITALINQGNLTEALTIAQRWVSADPLREEAHCALMRLFALLGRYTHALQQFDKLKCLLGQELRIEPCALAYKLDREIRSEIHRLAAEERSRQTAGYAAESLHLAFLQPVVVSKGWAQTTSARNSLADQNYTHHYQTAQHSAQLITATLARLDAPLGRSLLTSDRIQVEWIVNAGEEDVQVLRIYGKVGLRRHRVCRLVYQARVQGAAPTDADLAQALGVNIRTIERDVAALHKMGLPPQTRRRQLSSNEPAAQIKLITQ